MNLNDEGAGSTFESLDAPGPSFDPQSRDFRFGVFVGILVGEGHFGGDGRQPHITLKMHVVHEPLFRWIQKNFPGGRLYGPYSHSGRHFYQWMARGGYLRHRLVPLLKSVLSPDIDAKAFQRFSEMMRRYDLDSDAFAASKPSPPGNVFGEAS